MADATEEQRLRALERGRRLLKSKTKRRAAAPGDAADASLLSTPSASASEPESREDSPPPVAMVCVCGEVV